MQHTLVVVARDRLHERLRVLDRVEVHAQLVHNVLELLHVLCRIIVKSAAVARKVSTRC